MREPKKDFSFSAAAEPHRVRTQKILASHPEVREYIGKNPYTFLVILGVVGLQIGLAFVLRDQPWWLILIVAYFVGAFANHSLFVLIHECAHNLVFNKKVLNVFAGMIANLPGVTPHSVGFQRYHLKHHAFQGVYELDADIPNRWEAKLIGHSIIGKALWLLLYPFVQLFRPFRLKEIKVLDKWSITNGIIQIAFDVAIIYFWGWKAFLYFVFSLFFSIGLHPLGARWIQRHYLTGGDESQETFSYYGPLNKLALNVGYHNEHHDFPSVPWNRLPRVRQTAPEAYNNLYYHRSWTKLLFRFLFDRDITLFSRKIRNERGAVKLDDEVKPDIDLSEKVVGSEKEKVAVG